MEDDWAGSNPDGSELLATGFINKGLLKKESSRADKRSIVGNRLHLSEAKFSCGS